MFHANSECDVLNHLLSINLFHKSPFLYVVCRIHVTMYLMSGEIYKYLVCNYHVQNIHTFLIKYAFEHSFSYITFGSSSWRNSDISDMQKKYCHLWFEKLFISLPTFEISRQLRFQLFKILHYFSCKTTQNLQFDIIKVNIKAREVKMKRASHFSCAWNRNIIRSINYRIFMFLCTWFKVSLWYKISSSCHPPTHLKIFVWNTSFWLFSSKNNLFSSLFSTLEDT